MGMYSLNAEMVVKCMRGKMDTNECGQREVNKAKD